jgi:hypothetical protein
MFAGAGILFASGVWSFGGLTQSVSSQHVIATAPPSTLPRAAGPTKFARVESSATPKPTRTHAASPTAPPTLTFTATAVSEATPTQALALKARATSIAQPQSIAQAPLPPNPVAPTATATSSILGAEAITGNGTCAAIPSENYGTLPIRGAPTDRPAEDHPDLNLRLRTYKPVDQFRGLIDLDGETEQTDPQLVGLFADQRTPIFRNVYQVYDWDWSRNARGGLLDYPPVTLAGLGVLTGETIYVPNSHLNIGDGYQTLVLYASATRLTLKYTGEDNVLRGYTLQLEGVCVEPRLLALYQQQNAAGRGHLPALRAGQAIGRAMGDELGVAIRDSGTFMDPRSRKDWWKGR